MYIDGEKKRWRPDGVEDHPREAEEGAAVAGRRRPSEGWCPGSPARKCSGRIHFQFSTSIILISVK